MLKIKKYKSQLYKEHKGSLSIPGIHMQECHSDRLGHLPLFPDSISGFREKSDQKGLSGARAPHRKAQGALQSPGSWARRGHCSRRRLQRCLHCSLSSPTHPAGHTQLLWAAARGNSALSSGFEYRGKSAYLKRQPIIPALCDSQSLQCSLPAFHTSTSAQQCSGYITHI